MRKNYNQHYLAGKRGICSEVTSANQSTFIFAVSLARYQPRLRQATSLAPIEETHLSYLTLDKKFKIDKNDIKQLVGNLGGCMASDKITVEGELVDYMYREEPAFDVDNGWRFLSGTESQEYADEPNNWAIYDTNTIANYDQAIIPYLTLPIGTELERVKGTDKFKEIE